MRTAEDTGLERLQDSQGKPNRAADAARNPARLDQQTSELIRLFDALDDEAKGELLAIAHGLAERSQDRREQAKVTR